MHTERTDTRFTQPGDPLRREEQMIQVDHWWCATMPQCGATVTKPCDFCAMQEQIAEYTANRIQYIV